MKKILFFFLTLLASNGMRSQMNTGKYLYFSGEWQIQFIVESDGKIISSFELTDLKSGKTMSGKGEWRSVFKATKNEKGETPSKGTEVSFYDILIKGESYHFDVPRGGALMFEFPDGKWVGMKEKKL